jgi:hypothetical protein
MIDVTKPTMTAMGTVFSYAMVLLTIGCVEMILD